MREPAQHRRAIAAAATELPPSKTDVSSTTADSTHSSRRGHGAGTLRGGPPRSPRPCRTQQDAPALVVQRTFGMSIAVTTVGRSSVSRDMTSSVPTRRAKPHRSSCCWSSSASCCSPAHLHTSRAEVLLRSSRGSVHGRAIDPARCPASSRSTRAREERDMARYEFVEGASKKFWEIALEGTSFTTTYGRSGPMARCR